MTIRWPLVVAVGLLAGLAIAQNPPAFKTEKEKLSYALGMNLANQIRAQSVEVDPDVLSRGLKDALSNNKTLLTAEEVRVIVAGLQRELTAKRSGSQSESIRARKLLAAGKRGRADRGATRVPSGTPAPLGTAVTGISVSFKQEPHDSTYGEAIWVSRPTYTRVGDAKTCTVHVRVQGHDAKRRPVAASAKWTSADPEMATVTPSEGNEAKIVVHRVGESRVRVTSQGISKELTIRATNQQGVLLVNITQK